MACCRKGNTVREGHVIVVNSPAHVNLRDAAAIMNSKLSSLKAKYLPNDTTFIPIQFLLSKDEVLPSLLLSAEKSATHSDQPSIFHLNDAWGHHLVSTAKILRGPHYTTVLLHCPIESLVEHYAKADGAAKTTSKALIEYGIMFDTVPYATPRAIQKITPESVSNICRRIPRRTTDDEHMINLAESFLFSALGLPRGQPKVVRYIIPRSDVYDVVLSTRSTPKQLAHQFTEASKKGHPSRLARAVYEKFYDGCSSGDCICDLCKGAMLKLRENIWDPNARLHSTLPPCSACLSLATSKLGSSPEESLSGSSFDGGKPCIGDFLSTPNTGNENNYYYLHWHSVKALQFTVSTTGAEVRVMLSPQATVGEGYIVVITANQIRVEGKGGTLVSSAVDETNSLLKSTPITYEVSWGNSIIRVLSLRDEIVKFKETSTSAPEIQYISVASQSEARWELAMGPRGFGSNPIRFNSDSGSCGRGSLETPAGLVYSPFFPLKRIVFEVTPTKGSIGLLLTPTINVERGVTDCYEIQLGLAGDTLSVVRRKMNGENVATSSTSNLFKGKTSLWVSWAVEPMSKGATIMVGHEGNAAPFLQFKDDSGLNVEFFALTSLNGSSAVWRFPSPLRPMPVNTNYADVAVIDQQSDQRIGFEYYVGKFDEFPKFDQRVPTVRGSLPYFFVRPLSKEADAYVFRFRFYLHCTKKGIYKFAVGSPNKAILFIEGQRVVDISPLAGVEELVGTANLSEGTNRVEVHFMKSNFGTPFLQIKYQGADTKHHMVDIPQCALSKWSPSPLGSPTADGSLQLAAGHQLPGVFYEFTRPGGQVVDVGMMPALEVSYIPDLGPASGFDIKFHFGLIIIEGGRYTFDIQSMGQAVLTVGGLVISSKDTLPLRPGVTPVTLALPSAAKPVFTLKYQGPDAPKLVPVPEERIANLGPILFLEYPLDKSVKEPGIIAEAYDKATAVKAGTLDQFKALENFTGTSTVRMLTRISIIKSGDYNLYFTGNGAVAMVVDGVALARGTPDGVKGEAFKATLASGLHNLSIDVNCFGIGTILDPVLRYEGPDTNGKKTYLSPIALRSVDKVAFALLAPSNKDTFIQHLKYKKMKEINKMPSASKRSLFSNLDNSTKEKHVQQEPVKLTTTTISDAKCKSSTDGLLKFIDWRPVHKEKRLRFWFRGDGWAHVVLCQQEKTEKKGWKSTPMYEVVIGGENQWSCIRRGLGHVGAALHGDVEVSTPRIVSAGEFRMFWLKWGDDGVSLGRHKEHTPFLLLKDNSIPVQFYSVATSHGARGDWAFEDCSDCIASGWGPWGPCSKECEGGFRTSTRTVISTGHFGKSCPPLIKTEPCNIGPCKAPPQLGDWSNWVKPPKRCGYSQTYRTRAVISPGRGTEESPHVVDMKGVDDLECGNECKIGPWTTWSACSHISGGKEYKFRSVEETPGAMKKCPPATAIAQRECESPIPKRDCFVSDWSSWSPCTSQCGGGIEVRTRTILKEPIGDGAACPALTDSRPCNMQLCKKDCMTGPWSEWSACSTVCGGGVQRRTRSVTQPSEYGGNQCQSLIDERPCNTQACNDEALHNGSHQDCVLSEWSDWGSCSTSCGGGERVKTRHVISPPQNGGKSCPSDVTEYVKVEKCNPKPCDVDCQVTKWSDWSSCSSTCNGGEKVRTRSVAVPKSGNGKECPPLIESEVCNKGSCNSDCVLSPWSKWSECSKSCGGGEKTRYRTIITPAKGAGKCVESESQLFQKEVCNPQSCDQDAKVGEWGKWSTCTKTCGGGFQYRERPLLQQSIGEGKTADKLVEERRCNVEPCQSDCEVGSWGEWGACTKECGGGLQVRTRPVVSPPHGSGRECPITTQTRECNNVECPKDTLALRLEDKKDCIMSEWGPWSHCSVACGGGVQTRLRTISRKPGEGGVPCGPTEETRPCNDQPCGKACQVVDVLMKKCGNSATQDVICTRENGKIHCKPV